MVNKDLEIRAIHHSLKEHGLSKEIMNELKSVEPSLLIILDASANDSDQCKKSKKLGWIICVGEHHHSEKDNPSCILVSKSKSVNVENKGLCGTGVGFKIMQAIDHKLGVNCSKHFISYVWLANVSDSVPFTHPEQYTFAKWGRKYIHKNIQPFIDEFCDGKLNNKTIAWSLTPKLNSCVRLGTLEDKQELFSALCGEIDPTDIIDKCKKYHAQQSNQSRKMVEDVDIVNNSSVVIGRLPEKTTMTGLIAGKLMSKYGKPILLGRVNEDNGEFSGSVRSPIDFKDILADSGLTNFQTGHSRACGFGYPLSNEQAIIDYLDSVVSDCEPYTDVLCSCRANTIPNSLFSFVESYKHIFAKDLDTYNVHIQPFTIYNTDIKTLGRGNTIKFTKDGIDFISFFTSNEMKERLYMNVDEKIKLSVEVIGELCYNEFRGRKGKQCVIDKIECRKVDDEILDWNEIWGLTD